MASNKVSFVVSSARGRTLPSPLEQLWALSGVSWVLRGRLGEAFGVLRGRLGEAFGSFGGVLGGFLGLLGPLGTPLGASGAPQGGS